MKEDTIVNILHHIRQESYCGLNQVGSILTLQGRIIATGYNGTVSGDINDCEEDGVTKNSTVHAEQNVIAFCARNGIPTNNCHIYVSTSPCEHCAKLIIQAGIRTVKYVNEYRDLRGLELLKKAKIRVVKLENVCPF